MNWLLVLGIVYFIALVIVCLRIIYDTRNVTKTLAYLMVSIFLPVIGMIIYFSFGINYRKRKMYSKKLFDNKQLEQKLREDVFKYSHKIMEQGDEPLQSNKELALMLLKDSMSPLTANNVVKLLVNGETKFPDVLEALRQARHHIHIEYYIYDDDEIGRTIENILVQKAKEGVEVRFIYDDFGSRSIRKKLVPRLRAAGVKAFPFHRILFIALANRLNYRNHRKIIVVDGQTSFVGGINVSDRYVNQESGSGRLFWRDTHLRIDGPGTHYLQYLFLCDWNFCSKQEVKPDNKLFPPAASFPVRGNKVVQMAASGPDSDFPTILFSLLQAVHLASEEILITTPYFIPGDSIMDAIIVSALGGVKVKLLVPYKSDSKLVTAAGRSYYEDLLKAGVEVYLYKKGFVHAKTVVADRKIAIVGTANMDQRSFDLNFEVNAIVYNEETALQLREVFFEDLKHAEKLDVDEWCKRPVFQQLKERAARLVSPLL
ncbi:MAG TPA: cardiolipin synthase [Chitinophagaceae bacterium]|nr:cardiolipin synthase [Chitinophagaceae bacterium]